MKKHTFGVGGIHGCMKGAGVNCGHQTNAQKKIQKDDSPNCQMLGCQRRVDGNRGGSCKQNAELRKQKGNEKLTMVAAR
jgi:hypothetical protein